MNKMITFAITTYKEPKTIGRAIKAIENQANGKYEIIVCAADDETVRVAKTYSKINKKIKVIQDAGKGKPAALNLIYKLAKGEIIFFTDGDVYLDEKAIRPMIQMFKDKQVGAVTGRPISVNSTDNQMGFWAYMLTEIAHERRLLAEKENKRFFCSGYLFAIRKSLFPKLPEDLLSEDGYISHKVYESGYEIRYSSESRVYVQYPTNFSDWIKQKKRSAGGYSQIRRLLGVEIRSFRKESLGGTAFLKFVGNVKQLAWLTTLFLARIYLWIVIYVDLNIKKKTQKEMWKRVESTK